MDDKLEAEKIGEYSSSKSDYLSELEKISQSAQPFSVKLNLLDVLVKDFLRKKFRLPRDDEYSEMIDFFLQKKKPEIAIFCHNMVKLMYSGYLIDNNSVMSLVEEAKSVIESESSAQTVSSKHKNGGLFSFGKKKKIEAFDIRKVSKPTEKLIDKALVPEQGIFEPLTRKNTSEDGSVDELKSKLDLSMTESPEKIISDGDHQGIENIDNLERIKEKLRYRKVASAEKNLAQAQNY